MKVEISLSNDKEGWFLAGAALLFVTYKLFSEYGETIIRWVSGLPV